MFRKHRRFPGSKMILLINWYRFVSGAERIGDIDAKAATVAAKRVSSKLVSYVERS
jgi:hypothetical protein